MFFNEIVFVNSKLPFGTELNGMDLFMFVFPIPNRHYNIEKINGNFYGKRNDIDILRTCSMNKNDILNVQNDWSKGFKNRKTKNILQGMRSDKERIHDQINLKPENFNKTNRVLDIEKLSIQRSNFAEAGLLLGHESTKKTIKNLQGAVGNSEKTLSNKQISRKTMAVSRHWLEQNTFHSDSCIQKVKRTKLGHRDKETIPCSSQFYESFSKNIIDSYFLKVDYFIQQYNNVSWENRKTKEESLDDFVLSAASLNSSHDQNKKKLKNISTTVNLPTLIASFEKQYEEQQFLELWPKWETNLDYLVTNCGFNLFDVSIFLSRSHFFLHKINCRDDIAPLVNYLFTDLGMRRQYVRKIIRTVPRILLPRSDGSTFRDTINILEDLGLSGKRQKATEKDENNDTSKISKRTRKGKNGSMKNKSITNTKSINTKLIARLNTWPWLLAVTPTTVLLISGLLTSKVVGFKARGLGSFFRRAPWFLHESTLNILPPIVSYLRSSLGISDIEKIIRAYPEILSSDLEKDIIPIISYLKASPLEQNFQSILSSKNNSTKCRRKELYHRKEVKYNFSKGLGLSGRDVKSLIESLPRILSLNVKDDIIPMVQFFHEDIGVTPQHLPKIFRAFPAILRLNIEIDVLPVLNFLDAIGIKRKSTFISRLPAVVSYDVDNDLKPKYIFLIKALQLSVHDLCNYPGYLSLPLIDIILARTLFLVKELNQHPDMRIHFVGSDEYFVKETLGLENSGRYRKFKELLILQFKEHFGPNLKNVANIDVVSYSIDLINK